MDNDADGVTSKLFALLSECMISVGMVIWQYGCRNMQSIAVIRSDDLYLNILYKYNNNTVINQSIRYKISIVV